MRECLYPPHGDVRDFPDEQFTQRRDGEYVHEVEPRHTAKGRLVIQAPMDWTVEANERQEDPS